MQENFRQELQHKGMDIASEALGLAVKTKT